MFPRLFVRLVVFLTSLILLASLPSSTFVEIAQSAQEECSPNSTIVHIVSRGENLFRIARRYDTSVMAIVAANSITDSRVIFVGQRLVIPCAAGTGTTNLPSVNSPSSGYICGDFRLTSPLDGLRFGGVTFYWNPAPGATGYQLNIYRERDQGFVDGPLLYTRTVPATQTSLSADVGFPLSAHGYWFSWEVHAIAGEQVICSTPRWSIWRGPGPTPAPGTEPLNLPQGPFCGDGVCTAGPEDCETCPLDCGQC
jgi:hypothetical protein